jgi:hypothetical protein
LSSCHPLFDVTGTFNNPGPLGGYLVVGLVVAVLLYAFSFEKEYMFYQADYFRNHPQFAFLDVADNVTYPYNELLHIAVETGMCGLVLFLLVVSPFVFSDERTLKAALADIRHVFISGQCGTTYDGLCIVHRIASWQNSVCSGYKQNFLWNCCCSSYGVIGGVWPCNVVFNVKKELYFVGFYFKHAIFIPLHASSSVISLKAGRG